MGWIYLAQDRHQWKALLNTVMRLWVPQNVGKFLDSWATLGFSSRTGLHLFVWKRSLVPLKGSWSPLCCCVNSELLRNGTLIVKTLYLTFYLGAMWPVEVLKVLCRCLLKNFTAKFPLFKLQSFSSTERTKILFSKPVKQNSAINERDREQMYFLRHYLYTV
jgi:hypothetical protein